MSRSDLVRDCRSAARLIDQMKVLTERRLTLLKIHYPSLRNGDGLWPEYETVALEQAEHAPYRKLVTELTTLSRQLNGETKMESLMKWKAANLHYLVVEPTLVLPMKFLLDGACLAAMTTSWNCLSSHGVNVQ